MDEKELEKLHTLVKPFQKYIKENDVKLKNYFYERKTFITLDIYNNAFKILESLNTLKIDQVCKDFYKKIDNIHNPSPEKHGRVNSAIITATSMMRLLILHYFEIINFSIVYCNTIISAVNMYKTNKVKSPYGNDKVTNIKD